MTIKIEDIEIEELKIYHTLRDKILVKDESFIADSPKVVNLILESNDKIEIKSILATKEYYDEFGALIAQKGIKKLYETTKEEMSKIVGHKIHHNCMMHAIRAKDKRLEELGDNILLLDNITSSENVGAIARSMAALGVDSIMLGPSSPHPFNRRALRVSMGYACMLKINIYEEIKQSIRELKALGYRVYAAEVTKDATPLRHLKPTAKWVLIMGHEGFGISEEVLALCDEVVTIEMQENVKSFNVAVAASIMMYQLKNKVI